MRKKITMLFALMVAMLSTAMGQVAGTIDLTFERTGTTANDPTTATVTVVNSDSETTGIDATITSNYAWQEMSASTHFTNTSILCPNKNGNSIKNNGDEIVFTITLNNVPEDYTFGDVTLTSVGASAGGGYQGGTGGRTLTFTLKQGDTTLGTADKDIKVYSDGGVKLEFTIEATQEYSAVEGTLTLTLTLANKSGGAGCFYGLMKVSLATTYASEDPDVYKEMLQATIDEANAINWGETVGTYNMTTEIETAIENAEKLVESSTDIAELEAANTVLSNLIANPTMNMPEAGKLYAFKSAATDDYCRGKYMHANTTTIVRNAYYSYDHRHLLFDEMEIDATALWQFTKDMKMKNVQTNEYVVSFNKNVTHMGTEADAAIITMEALGEGQVALRANGGNHMHAQKDNSVIVHWNGSKDNASAWYCEKVEVFSHSLTIDEHLYMTLQLGYAVTIPAGVQAYAVTGTGENNVLQMEEITGVIPANEAVVIYAKNPDTYAFTYTTETGTKPETNYMKGSLYDTYIAPDGTPYVMALVDENIVMGKAKLNLKDDGTTDEEAGTHFKNRANKAYLDLPPYNGAPMYSFDRGEGTTAIDNALQNNDKVVIYDLTGRCVERMEKGLYIVNGKKVVIK